MKDYKRYIKNISIVLFLLVFCLSSFPSFASSGMETEKTVVMTETQYSSLKRNLAELETNLAVLEQNSSMDKRQLLELRTELQTLKEQMKRADNSLETAEESLKKARELSEKLTKQTESLRHKLVVKERQNRLAWVIAGGLLIGFAISK